MKIKLTIVALLAFAAVGLAAWTVRPGETMPDDGMTDPDIWK